jgi:DNA-binding MarR family transcriptional regulator
MQQNSAGRRSVDATTALAQQMHQTCLGVRVARLHRLVMRRYDEQLRDAGLTISQVEILSALQLVPDPIRPSDLARYLGIERSTMSRNLAVLAEKHLAAASQISPTGRAQRITITPVGRATLRSAGRAWATAQAAVRDSLGADAAELVDRWIDTLAGTTPEPEPYRST